MLFMETNSRFMSKCFSHRQVGKHGGESGCTGESTVKKGNLRNKNARGSVTILKMQLESSIRSAFLKNGKTDCSLKSQSKQF